MEKLNTWSYFVDTLCTQTQVRIIIIGTQPDSQQVDSVSGSMVFLCYYCFHLIADAYRLYFSVRGLL